VTLAQSVLPATSPGRRALSALLRYAGYLGFWVLLAGTERADLTAGLIAAAIATAVSLRLLPPSPGWPHLGAGLHLFLSFLWQSLVSGLDIAYRVLHPRLPLQPGLVRYPVRLPAGPLRSSFAALTGAIPGTLPVGTAGDGVLLYHCLDTRAPVHDQLQRDEARMHRAAGLGVADLADAHPAVAAAERRPARTAQHPDRQQPPRAQP